MRLSFYNLIMWTCVVATGVYIYSFSDIFA